MDNLEVIVDGKLIGILHNKHPLSFSYSDDCLNGLISNPFDSIISIKPGEISTPNVLAYFENLLPEGDQRLALQEKYHVSSVFGLLSMAGWDTAGSILLRPKNSDPEPHSYTPKTWSEISKIIDGHGSVGDFSKASISGAQYKILLSLDHKNNPMLPIGSSPTTHILKPDIKREGQKIWSSAINETIVMKMADKCGLPVASVSYIRIAKSCLVKRYDRDIDENGIVTRKSQSDLCQLLGKPSSIKYENEGGPRFSDCYSYIKGKSSNPIIDCENIVKWLFFNLYTGNNDSHAKNLSMISSEDGYQLAPFYDLMCTTIYSGFSNNFAFNIGGTYKPGEIDNEKICALARSVGASEKHFLKISREIFNKISVSMEESIKDLLPNMDVNEKLMAEKLIFEISSVSKKRSNKIFEKPMSQEDVKARADKAREFIENIIKAKRLKLD